jgi:hypothetical protein
VLVKTLIKIVKIIVIEHMYMVCNGSHLEVCDLVPNWVMSVSSLFWMYVCMVPRLVFHVSLAGLKILDHVKSHEDSGDHGCMLRIFITSSCFNYV